LYDYIEPGKRGNEGKKLHLNRLKHYKKLVATCYAFWAEQACEVDPG